MLAPKASIHPATINPALVLGSEFLSPILCCVDAISNRDFEPASKCGHRAERPRNQLVAPVVHSRFGVDDSPRERLA